VSSASTRAASHSTGIAVRGDHGGRIEVAFDRTLVEVSGLDGVESLEDEDVDDEKIKGDQETHLDVGTVIDPGGLRRCRSRSAPWSWTRGPVHDAKRRGRAPGASASCRPRSCPWRTSRQVGPSPWRATPGIRRERQTPQAAGTEHQTHEREVTPRQGTDPSPRRPGNLDSDYSSPRVRMGPIQGRNLNRAQFDGQRIRGREPCPR
jgi:hypothetical protein